jgi:hypothetical protein
MSFPLIVVIGTYGYSPEDITILKDDPQLPDHFQPTFVNMVRHSPSSYDSPDSRDRFVNLLNLFPMLRPATSLCFFVRPSSVGIRVLLHP